MERRRREKAGEGATNQEDRTVGGHRARKLWRLVRVGTASRSIRVQKKQEHIGEREVF